MTTYKMLTSAHHAELLALMEDRRVARIAAVSGQCRAVRAGAGLARRSLFVGLPLDYGGEAEQQAKCPVVAEQQTIHDSIQSEHEVAANRRYLREAKAERKEAFAGLEPDDEPVKEMEEAFTGPESDKEPGVEFNHE